MNKESMYFRLSIPGWVFIFLVLTYYIVANWDDVFIYIVTGQLTKSFGSVAITALIATVVALGTPLGYMINMIYFKFWKSNLERLVLDKLKGVEKFPEPENWGEMEWSERYFYLEFIWHKCLMQLEEHQQSYIERRYSHLLNRTHSYGTLMTSCWLSMFATLIFGLLFGDNITISIVYFLVSITLSNFSLSNYLYYERNLNAFQRNTLKLMLKEDDFSRKIVL